MVGYNDTWSVGETFYAIRSRWNDSNLLKMARQQGRTHFRNRWRGNEGDRLAGEVWRRLAAGESLHDLGLGENDGYSDLRGISTPRVTKAELPPFRNWALHDLKGFLEFRKVHFDGMDFSDSRLEYLHFFNSRINNCRFDRADCKSWNVKASDITGTSFVRADLRDAGLGLWHEGRGNVYRFVDFSQADMRDSISTSADYIDCDFSYARLDKVEFDSSGFIRCRFAGEVREVIFYDRGFKSPKPNPNPMEDVDFSKAQLRWCAFRRLNLDRVLLPRDRHHLIVRNYRCVLEKAIAELEDHQSLTGRGLKRVLENDLKWIGPQQEIGVFNDLDFLEAWGPEGQQFATELLRRAEDECAKSSIT